ncbi:BrnT family toxin [Plasticicumulans sp.]
MRYEWDEAKRQQNLVKHGLDFVHAVAVLEHPDLLLIADNRRVITVKPA